ncbi:probable SWI/SNF-related matrix-associated actin-dependent regulator [Coccomyxa sp. Obi]|nr:probable SWI/SNF-related matrix-associated actin-dependent regulator [Coccomyxa sp. Obi]
MESDDDVIRPANPNFQLHLNLTVAHPKPLSQSNRLEPASASAGPFDKYRLGKPATLTQDVCEADPIVPAQPRKRRRLVKLADEQARAKKERSPDAPLRPQRTVRHVIDSDSDDTHVVATANVAEKALSEQVEEVADTSDDEQAIRAVMHVDLCRDQGGAVDLAEVGEESETDHVDDVLHRCEAISQNLRSVLGGKSVTDRVSSLDTTPMVTHEALVAACGDAAKYLKSYQLVGVNFLTLLARSGVGGAIMADEMGLGKTAQAIAFLGVRRVVDEDTGPHIIVVPASLLENWQRELQRWCPSLKVVLYYGKDRAQLREELLEYRRGQEQDTSEASGSAGEQEDSESGKDLEDSDVDSAEESDEEYHASDQEAELPVPENAADSGDAPFDVLLTCYTLFERDSYENKRDRMFLKKWNWSCMVLDEAHAVKNRSAARTTRLNRVAMQCKQRIMLTGTPLQNDLQELQNLLGFLLPDVFKDDAATHLANVQDEEEMQLLTERMKALLGPFVLRRLKSEVASQLAAKDQRIELVDMTAPQADMYAEAVQQLRKEASAAGLQAGAPGREEAQTPAAAKKLVRKLGKQKVANLFTHLRKIAQHPLLVRRLFSDEAVAKMASLAHARGLFGEQCSAARVREEMAGYSDFQLHRFTLQHPRRFGEYALDAARVMDSGKCAALARLLPQLKAEGHHPLIFSQWTSVLDVLEWLLDQLGLPFLRLDGSTAVADRLALVDQYNNPSSRVFAFLLSTRAGGQGLNLTRADTVILHDVDFNPQIDRQAEDRCHRLGQKRTVTVYRLVTRVTVDEGIHALATRKLRLDAAVLEGITATGDARKGKGGDSAADTVQMGELLQSLIANRPMVIETAEPQRGDSSQCKHDTETVQEPNAAEEDVVDLT